MDLTASTVVTVLRSAFEDYGYSDNFWDAICYEIPNEGIDSNGIHVEHVESFGGEGQGDTAWVVVKATRGDEVKFFRKDGYYASYDGFTWDGAFAEVTPKEKTVTVYETMDSGDVLPAYSVQYDSFDGDDSFL